MFDVLCVATFILLIFAILGVQLFSGRFAACSRGEHLDKVACEAVGGLWANPAFGNFDDIAAAALLLFEMAGDLPLPYPLPLALALPLPLPLTSTRCRPTCSPSRSPGCTPTR